MLGGFIRLTEAARRPPQVMGHKQHQGMAVQLVPLQEHMGQGMGRGKVELQLMEPRAPPTALKQLVQVTVPHSRQLRDMELQPQRNSKVRCYRQFSALASLELQPFWRGNSARGPDIVE